MPLFLKNLFSPAGIVALAIGTAGIAASGFYALHQHAGIFTVAKEDFDRSTDLIAEELTLRFTQPVFGLNGTKTLFVSSDQVFREEFRQAIASRDIKKEFPGVRGFSFIQRIEKSELNNFIEQQRQDLAPDFSLRQLEDKGHNDHFIVKFIEPAVNNPGALGLDIGSEARRRTAIEHAVDTGNVSMTELIYLVQDNKETPGVLIFVPIYASEKPLNSKEDRRRAPGRRHSRE